LDFARHIWIKTLAFPLETCYYSGGVNPRQHLKGCDEPMRMVYMKRIETTSCHACGATGTLTDFGALPDGWLSIRLTIAESGMTVETQEADICATCADTLKIGIALTKLQ